MVISDHITTQDAAERAGITPAYVRILALTGKIPYTRVGRMYMVRAVDIDSWQSERALRIKRLEAKRGKRG